jgi:hypothetical protein
MATWTAEVTFTHDAARRKEFTFDLRPQVVLEAGFVQLSTEDSTVLVRHDVVDSIVLRLNHDEASLRSVA